MLIDRDKCIVLDLDGTLCPVRKANERYEDLIPNQGVVQRLLEYRQEGFYIIILTSRTMRTYQGNLGLINANSAKPVLDWLQQHNIPYDEIYFGKPWPGQAGFYVDDRAIRPDEFVRLSSSEVRRLLSNE